MIKNITPLPPKFPENYCNCDEVFVGGACDAIDGIDIPGTQVPQPRYHDCRYITERNLRIPAAARRAEAHRVKVCGEPPMSPPKSDKKEYGEWKLKYEKWLIWSAKVENARFTAEMDQQLRVI